MLLFARLRTKGHPYDCFEAQITVRQEYQGINYTPWP